MPTVNERCKILRSLNRVYVFEIVLLLVPRLKILRGLSIWDLGSRILRNKEAQEYKSSSQVTNHNSRNIPYDMAMTSAPQAMPPQHLWDPKQKSAHLRMALYGV